VFSGLQTPAILLETPLLVELVGAGFTKAPKSKVSAFIHSSSEKSLQYLQHYELRFPRIIKVHRAGERPWTSAVDTIELHKIACSAIGRDPSLKVARDSIAEIWGQPCSPGAKCGLKRKAETELWEERLASLDGRKVENRSMKVNMNSSTKITQPVPKIALQAVTNIPLKTKVIIDLCSPDSETPITKTPVMNKAFEGPENRYLLSQPSLKGTLSPTMSPPLSLLFWKNTVVWSPRYQRRDDISISDAKFTFPNGRRLHSFQSLLVGCGWQSTGRSWADVERGFILLEPRGEWLDHVQKKLKEIQAATSSNTGRKPIYILDKSINWLRLQTTSNVEELALVRFI
jgi:DNA ligase 4